MEWETGIVVPHVKLLLVMYAMLKYQLELCCFPLTQLPAEFAWGSPGRWPKSLEPCHT